jgi:hypothetical protein
MVFDDTLRRSAACPTANSGCTRWDLEMLDSEAIQRSRRRPLQNPRDYFHHSHCVVILTVTSIESPPPELRCSSNNNSLRQSTGVRVRSFVPTGARLACKIPNLPVRGLLAGHTGRGTLERPRRHRNVPG